MMNTSQSQLRALKHCVLGVAGLAVGSGVAHADGDWTKRFRLGVISAFNVEAEFSLGGGFGVSSADPGTPGVSGQNHTYDDGYVRLDDTGNAGGFTSNWGYQNASQYDSATQTFTFHGTTSYSQEGSQATASDAPYYGIDLAYGGRVVDFARGALGWEFGFTYLPAKFEDSSPHNVTAERVTHRFNAPGIVPPQAPYNGGSSGLGVTIQDVAHETGSVSTSGVLTGSRSVDLDLMNFRFGPNLQWHLGGRWAASLGGGLAMGLATGEYSFNEQVEYASGGSAASSGRFSNTEWVLGGYAEALLYYHTNESAELYVGAQYMSLGDVTFNGDGRQARLKLGNGLMIAAGIHWIF